MYNVGFRNICNKYSCLYKTVIPYKVVIFLVYINDNNIDIADNYR